MHAGAATTRDNGPAAFVGQNVRPGRGEAENEEKTERERKIERERENRIPNRKRNLEKKVSVKKAATGPRIDSRRSYEGLLSRRSDDVSWTNRKETESGDFHGRIFDPRESLDLIVRDQQGRKRRFRFQVGLRTTDGQAWLHPDRPGYGSPPLLPTGVIGRARNKPKETSENYTDGKGFPRRVA